MERDYRSARLRARARLRDLMAPPLRGAVLWRGPSAIDGGAIMAYASGIREKGSNDKLDPESVQIWTMRSDMPPGDVWGSGAERSVCGTCPLKGKGPARRCYVRMDPLSNIWGAYQRGNAPKFDLYQRLAALKGRYVRLGAYGEPTALPEPFVRGIVEWVRMTHGVHTGYTHTWRTCDPSWSRLLMASTEDLAGYERARSLGWRAYHVVPVGTPEPPPGSIWCPATMMGGKRTTCSACGLCDGKSGPKDRRPSIAAWAHGAGARRLSAVIQSLRIVR